MTNNKNTDKKKNKDNNNPTEVTIGSTIYKSLCLNCQFSKDIRLIHSPRSNADVQANIPAYYQYYCPTVHTDLIYLKYGENEVMYDVAECNSCVPLKQPITGNRTQDEITGDDIRKKKQSSKSKHND